MNFNAIFKISVRILGLSSLALFSCIFVALFYNEPTAPFLYSGGITFFSAFIIYLLSTKADIDLEKKEAFLSVSMAWLLIALAGTLPYLFSGSIPSFANAFFESVSGFSTTGASILTDVESLPKSILFWRSLTHWIGGIGIIILVIIIMPSLKMGSYNLFSMESSLQEKILPRIKEMGIRLLGVYILLTLVLIFFLLIGGMETFDSICHSLSTVATGGFSTKNTSITNYSPYIQYVITVFMFLSGTNFIILYFLLKGNFQKIKDNEELKFYMIIILICTFILTVFLHFNTDRSLEKSFRDSLFQVTSQITTTGFSSSDYMLWPSFGWVFMFILLFLGGSTGSTTGGIKMARYLILFKNARRIYLNLIHPNSIKQIKLNNKIINTEDNNSILLYICVYFLAWFVGSVLLIFLGLDAKTAMSSIATSIGGVGPGIGTVGPASNYAHLPDLAKYIMSFYMILGRLEIYTLLILFTPAFWKKV